MATPMTHSHRPLSFAVPQVGGTAILPQTVALGVVVKVVRANTDYFGISADGFDHSDRSGVAGRLGSVWWNKERERWIVERNVPGLGNLVTSGFRREHLRAALGSAIIDTATEYVLDRDEVL